MEIFIEIYSPYCSYMCRYIPTDTWHFTRIYQIISFLILISWSKKQKLYLMTILQKKCSSGTKIILFCRLEFCQDIIIIKGNCATFFYWLQYLIGINTSHTTNFCDIFRLTDIWHYNFDEQSCQFKYII